LIAPDVPFVMEPNMRLSACQGPDGAWVWLRITDGLGKVVLELGTDPADHPLTDEEKAMLRTYAEEP
jgi:hypothetical protein